jgi:hypothetical protein
MNMNGHWVDGFGLVITPHGVVRIPPWDPPMAARINAATKIAALAEHGIELGVDVEALLAELVRPVLDQTGEIGSGALAAFDGDGDGIYCGNGRIGPIPRPKGGPWQVDVSERVGASLAKNVAEERLTGR